MQEGIAVPFLRVSKKKSGTNLEQADDKESSTDARIRPGKLKMVNHLSWDHFTI